VLSQIPRCQHRPHLQWETRLDDLGWSSTAYPGAGGEIHLTEIAMIADGSMVGRILFSGSRCASWANFSGRVSGDSASLSMYVGQCGLTVATLKHVANGWVGSYRSQYPDSGVVQLAQ